MILIVTKEKLEPSTENVIDWLYFYHVPFLRLNGDSLYQKHDVFLEITNAAESCKLGVISDKSAVSKEFKSAWFRRWSDEAYYEQIGSANISTARYHAMSTVVKNDQILLRSYLFSQMTVKNWLTPPNKSSLNKLEVLRKARQLGLKIPETIVTTNRRDIVEFKNKFQRIISKDLSTPYHLYEDEETIGSYTFEVDDVVLAQIPENFVPSLFQKLIEKSYEIRSFYLDEKFYSMAIFSQSEAQTQIDFRKYTKKGNRNVPYKLPDYLENQLKRLMDELGLNTGSVDIIKSETGEFIFLEINSVGQFGMTSMPCNYHLEKIIAEYLIKNNE